jgi:hypothetical protein
MNFGRQEEDTPRASTQSFLEANLRVRFNPDGTPEALKSLAEACIREGKLQYASEIGQHLCYKASDVTTNREQYFEAAIHIAKAIMADIMENRVANFIFVRNIVNLLPVEQGEYAEFFREYEAFTNPVLPICKDKGTLSISRAKLPAKLEDPISLETINPKQLDPNQKLYVLCTTDAPDGILGKGGTVVFLESTLKELQTRNAAEHPTTRGKIIGFRELNITD